MIACATGTFCTTTTTTVVVQNVSLRMTDRANTLGVDMRKRAQYPPYWECFTGSDVITQRDLLLPSFRPPPPRPPPP